MPCEHYKDALSEAAATGAAPHGELRTHLEVCASCRANFVEEQSLFNAIDCGLHAAVNEAVPPFLLPRVRASLDEAVVAHPRWFIRWPLLVGAAVSVAILFAVVVSRQNNIGHKPEDSVGNNSRTSPANVAAAIPSSLGPTLPSQPNALPRVPVAKSLAPQPASDGRNSSPQVLVPRDQEVLLASYVQQWSARKRAPLLAANLDETTVAPLEVAPIQIDQLDVKPLAEGNSQ